VWGPLAYVLMAAALVIGVWCLVSAARNRYLVQAQYTALLGLFGLVLIQGIVSVVLLVSGSRPVEFALFVGYLATLVLLLPAALILVRMEPTRWGSAIAGAAALTVAVLTLRSLQIWTPLS
jgi:hypothetical protein